MHHLRIVVASLKALLGSSRSRELSAVGDDNSLPGFVVAVARVALNSVENFHTTDDLAEDDVSTVEMGGVDEAEEELAAVSAWASVSHGKDTTAGVLELEVLVSEVRAIDGLATSAVSGGEVTTLSHESLDDTVERAALEVERLA